MLLAIYLCLSNIIIHFQETEDLHLEDRDNIIPYEMLEKSAQMIGFNQEPNLFID